MITMDIEETQEKSFEPQQLPLERWDDAQMMAALYEQDDLYRKIERIDSQRRDIVAEYKAERAEVLDSLLALQERIRSQRAAR